MLEVKGKSTIVNQSQYQNSQTIDEFDESISGLDRESVSRQNLEGGLETSNRDGDNASLDYAFSDLTKLDNHPLSKSGVSSMMNDFAMYHHNRCRVDNDFFDVQGSGGAYPKHTQGTDESGSGGRNVTIESLLDQFSPNNTPSTPYTVSDFLYAKFYRKIPLNHLITVRRFPFPTYDNLFFADGKDYRPLAQAVTYFGDPSGNNLKDLTKINGYINWKEMEANVHEVDGNERGLNETPFIPRGVGKLVSIANGKTDLSGRQQAGNEAGKNYSDPSYTGRTLGPVNVVNKTHIRDRGLGADQEFTLVFEYQLKSYNGINPRLAMLDIICNMLALTFNNAKFWGGANRYHPNKSQFGFIGDQKAFYNGDYGTYIDSFIGEIGSAAQTGLDMFKSMIRNIFSGNFKDLFTSIARGVGTTMLDLKAAKSRPQILGFKALLTGNPVGEWHLTIGNPHQPIMRIGNLICTGFECELGEELGIDDFPTELKWTINLKNGRPRDKGDIESMFNDGQGRIYHAPPNTADVLNLSSTTGVNVIPNNGSNSSNPAKGTDEKEQTGATIDVGSDRNLNDNQISPDYLRKLEGTVF